MLEEWTEITVSVFISLLEWNITVFIFFIVNFILLMGKPKLNFIVLEHLLLVVTGECLDWTDSVAV